jgi:sugar-specific transcriptional regulator TrmB
MNDKILQEAGLTPSQAAAYIALVKHSPCSPPNLATLIDESRTNTYKLLEQLEELNLVSRDETQKKLRYWANNPSLLVNIIKKKRLAAEEAEKRFNDSLPTLMENYFEHSERPSIQYFHGIEGVREIYDDQLDTGEPISFIEAVGGREFFSDPILHDIRNLFPKKGIERKVISRDKAYRDVTVKDRLPIAESDKQMLLKRTWIKDVDYASPVEWSVYGDKLSIVSLGGEAIGIVIKSKQIAESFRQIFTLLEDNIPRRTGYKNLPKNLLHTRKPS